MKVVLCSRRGSSGIGTIIILAIVGGILWLSFFKKNNDSIHSLSTSWKIPELPKVNKQNTNAAGVDFKYVPPDKQADRYYPDCRKK